MPYLFIIGQAFEFIMEEITLIEAPSLPVLGIKKRGKYSLIAELLPKIFVYAMEQHIPIAGMPMFLCHERTPEEVMAADQSGTAEVEVAVPVASPAQGRGEIQFYTITGGRMARILHHGPYEACEPTYWRLFAWIADQGLQIQGPIREVYHNDPREVRPDEILTEILAPVG